jgi:hypothetical protein
MSRRPGPSRTNVRRLDYRHQNRNNEMETVYDGGCILDGSFCDGDAVPPGTFHGGDSVPPGTFH